jgi:hypothetical protein
MYAGWSRCLSRKTPLRRDRPVLLLLPFILRRTAGATTPPDYASTTSSDVIDDTIDARIYLGIHFRAPDVHGADIGQGVAHWLDKYYFQKAK